MANNFKSALSANVGNTAVAVYTTPATKKSIVIELDIANTTNDAVTVSVGIGTGADIAFHVVKNAVIPSGDSLQVISGQKVVLDGSTTAQKVFVKTMASGQTVDVIGSVLEDVQ